MTDDRRDEFDTEVLVIGVGPAGSAAALALASLGVQTQFVTKYRWTANTPRAHITNQRSMEFFRDQGVEAQVAQDATPHHLIGDTVFCTSLTGEELGRIWAWGVGPQRIGDYTAASPTLPCDIPQTLLEPILLRNAVQRGALARLSTEYLSHEQDSTGVTTRLRDRLTGHEYSVRSRYLIGADGARSQIAREIDLPFEGEMDVAGSMNITFKADLAPLVAHRPSVLYWVLRPGADIGGIGMGLVRMVRMWDEWLIVWGYDITQAPPTVDEDAAIAIVRDLVGAPDLEVEIRGTSLWGNNRSYATTLHRGRVFCMGDAIHRHPPSNGLGSNTSVQDAYNLAWKLAYVLNGTAGEGLLDTYTEERAPVAETIVTRADRSSGEFAPVFEALGVLGTSDPERMQAGIDSRKDDTAEAEARRNALVRALEAKDYEFNCHGVELNQFYDSRAIVPDGSGPVHFTRDQQLYHQPSTKPGAHLPHAWLLEGAERLSTLDAAGSGVFSIFTGIAGSPWVAAAEKLAEELGIDIRPIVIGPGRRYQDAYGDWTRLREIQEGGVLLVRPDKHVAFRAAGAVDDPEAALRKALATALVRS